MRRTTVEVEILGPDQLEFLSRLFSETANMGEDDQARDERASRIVNYYTAGVTNEAELRALSEPAGFICVGGRS